MNLKINSEIFDENVIVKSFHNKGEGYPSIDRIHEKGKGYFVNNPIIPSMSIHNALKLMSFPYRKENAVDCLDLRASYIELFDAAETLSKSFKELGIKEKDIITVSMSNFYQALVTFIAANRIGATTTFLNEHSSIEEVKYYLNLFESPLFVDYDKNLEYNRSIKKGTKIRQIITLHKEDLNKKDFVVSDKKNIGYNDFISFGDIGNIASLYKHYIKTNYSGNQDALILFTSGSTGNPKSVVLTNKNILSSGIYMKNSANLSNTVGEKSLVCVPFCYPYGFATSTLMSLLCGREAILAPGLTAENISYYYSKNPNIVFGSPALLELTKRNIPQGQDLSSVHTFISGGDFLLPSQSKAGEEFFAKHGADVKMCNGSGNAETVGASTNAVGVPSRPETVGKVLNGQKALIIDPDTYEEKKYGEEGLYCVSGENIFKEYYKEPELTKKSKFKYNGDIYLKTGTMGILDEEGYFTLTGRDSRFYIMSTLNKVYCDHVQTAISAIDCVDSCAVVKVPDDELLFVNKVFIVLKEGILPTEEVMDCIKQMCGEQLTITSTAESIQLKPYEIPSYFEFVDTLPRNRGDKVDYKYLETLAAEQHKNNKINNQYVIKK